MMLESVQRWLDVHCEGREDIAGAVVVHQAVAGGEYEPAARYPADGVMHAALTNVAREAVRRGSSLVMVPAVVQPDAGYTRVVALPVKVDTRVAGAVALAVRSADAAVAKRLLEDVERVSSSLAAALSSKGARAGSPADNGCLNLLNVVAGEAGLDDSALRLANRIAQDFQFDRVSVSLLLSLIHI